MSNAKNKILQLLIIVTVACLGQAATDIYTPSLPAISQIFGVSMGSVQLTLATYMIGFSFSQLFYGPLSEGLGRRTPLLIGLTVMLIGSLICVFSTNIHMLILARFIQGSGAGACAALWRSTFRDLFQGEELSKYGAYAGTVITFIMPAIPALGGYFQHYLGWQASFVFITICVIIAALLILFFFKETSQHHHIKRLKLTFIYNTFKELLTHKMFLGYSLCVLLTYGGVFAWAIISPVLLMKQMGLTPVIYGWIILAGTAFVMFFGGLFNGKLVSKIGMERMLELGWLIMLVCGILVVAGYFLFGLNVYAVTIPSILFMFGATLIWPNTFACAFKDAGNIAGYAGALYGCFQIGGGALAGILAAHLPNTTQVPMGLMFIATPLAAWSAFKLIHR